MLCAQVSQGQLGPLSPLVGMGVTCRQSSGQMETPVGKHLGVCLSEALSGQVLAVGCENWLRAHAHLPPPVSGLKSVHLWTGLQPSPPSVHSPYCPPVPPTSPGLLPAGQPLLEARTLPSQEGSPQPSSRFPAAPLNTPLCYGWKTEAP